MRLYHGDQVWRRANSIEEEEEEEEEDGTCFRFDRFTSSVTNFSTRSGTVATTR